MVFPLRFRALAAVALIARTAYAQAGAPTSTASSLGTVTSPALTLSAAPATIVSGCPAAVSTTNICSTCVTADCVVEETVTVSCGCPNPPATILSDHPCSLGCDGLGCGTVYNVVTAECTGNAGSGSITGTAPLPTGATETGGDGTAGAGPTANAGCRVAPFRFW